MIKYSIRGTDYINSDRTKRWAIRLPLKTNSQQEGVIARKDKEYSLCFSTCSNFSTMNMHRVHYFWNTNLTCQHTQADHGPETCLLLYRVMLVLGDTQGTEISANQVPDEGRSLFSCYHNLQAKGNPTNL